MTANWHPDPTGQHELRYWDGQIWTEHVADQGVQSISPLPAAPPTQQEEVVEESVVEEPVAEEPVIDEPVVDEPAIDEPAIDEPVVEDAVIDEPVIDEPVVEEPIVEEPVVEEPAVEAIVEEAPTEVPDIAQQYGVDTDPFADRTLTEVASTEDVAEVPVVEDSVVEEPVTEAVVAEEQAAAEEEPAHYEVVNPLSAGPIGDEDDLLADVVVTEQPEEPAAAPPQAAPTPGISGELIDGRFSEVAGDGAALQNARMLRVRVGESFLARQGAMVAYQGDVTFAYQGSGAAKFLKKAVTGEGLSLMRVEGQGDVFLADTARHVHILNLTESGISVNGANVLAFSSSLDWNVERVKGGSIAAGGLFNTTLRGTGWVAITTDGEPVVLNAGEAPTFADTDAIVAWSADLQTSLRSTMTAGGAIGRGSGEAVQVTFAGQGFVIVQPSEGMPVPAR